MVPPGCDASGSSTARFMGEDQSFGARPCGCRRGILASRQTWSCGAIYLPLSDSGHPVPSLLKPARNMSMTCG